MAEFRGDAECGCVSKKVERTINIALKREKTKKAHGKKLKKSVFS